MTNDKKNEHLNKNNQNEDLNKGHENKNDEKEAFLMEKARSK